MSNALKYTFLFLSLLLVVFIVWMLAGGFNESTPTPTVPTVPYTQLKAPPGEECVPQLGHAHMGICAQHKYGTTFSPTIPYGQKGIDISNYQGYPNFSYAKSQGLAFVLNQSGDGSGFHDENFATNWAREKALGIPHGAYIFLRPGCALCQANAIYADIQRVGGQDAKAFPPVLDAEVGGAYEEVCPVATFLRAKLHKPVIVYTSPGLWPGLGSCGTLSWPAEWGSNGYAFGPWSTYVAQQYSGTGYFPGVGGQVDLDVNHGLLATITPPPPPVHKETRAQKHAHLNKLVKEREDLRRYLIVYGCRARVKNHEVLGPKCKAHFARGRAVNAAITKYHNEGVS